MSTIRVSIKVIKFFVFLKISIASTLKKTNVNVRIVNILERFCLLTAAAVIAISIKSPSANVQMLLFDSFLRCQKRNVIFKLQEGLNSLTNFAKTRIHQQTSDVTGSHDNNCFVFVY